MGCCFGAICKKLWGAEAIGEVSSGQSETLRSRKRVVKMCFSVFVIFGICWLPYQFYFIYVYHYPQIIATWYVQHVFLAFYWLAMSTAMVNPLVYYWMNQRFRVYFTRVLRTIFCCTCVTGSTNRDFTWLERGTPAYSSAFSFLRQAGTVRRSSTQITALEANDLELATPSATACACRLPQAVTLSLEAEPLASVPPCASCTQSADLIALPITGSDADRSVKLIGRAARPQHV
ncbi:tachykinin-like peptides receptor 86C [Pollicipes pollicipes]|uniref:tachykinin-like peptides receptor 86C n=1 Tax=Pollicipes pollicipes TaxID=41117 RepID=UPI0018851F01|nr:tachykinin-like peptides receptor 86C [Pollicipes pollicipes]